MPGSVLEVLELESGEKFTADRVSSFLIPRENGRWLAYLNDKKLDSNSVKPQNSKVVESYEVTPEGLRRPEKKPKLKKRPSETKIENEKPEEKGKTTSAKMEKAAESKSEAAAEKSSDEAEEKKKKTAGTTLVLRDLKTGIQQTYPNVVRYWFPKNGSRLAFVTSIKVDEKAKSAKKANPKDDVKKGNETAETDQPTDGVFVVDLEDLESQRIAFGEGEYKNLAFNEDGSQLAFLTNKDD